MAAEVVILGTGGTIAGAGSSPDDPMDYRAGQIGVAQLIAAIPALGRTPLVAEQVAQIDSKDMEVGVWQVLAARCMEWLGRPRVRGVVVTHGTDTIEETAFFLSRVLPPASRPVVLTCAMRPATAPAPDGPRNLLDAVTLACDPAARGVLVVCAGRVHGALNVCKAHPQRLDAFSSGAAGPLARIEGDRVDWLGEAPPPASGSLSMIESVLRAAVWPRVEIVLSHAAAGGAIVRALLADGVRGIVAAGTGNGTLHRELEAALLAARQAGVRVVRATRCAEGSVRPRAGDPFEPAGELSPVKARIALMLRLLED